LLIGPDMKNLKLQALISEELSPALRRKLNKKLEEAGIAFDLCYAEGRADQGRVLKLRNRARTLSKQVIAKQPENLDGLNLLGRIALDEGNLNLAQSILDEGLSYHPKSASLLYSRAHVHLALQEYEKAAKLFTQAEDLAPRDTRSRVSLAYTKVKQGLFVEAFDEYSELIKLDPTDPHIRSKLFECIKHIQVDFYSLQIEEELVNYLEFTQVDHNDLSGLITSLLIHKYDLINGNTPLDPQQLSKDELLNKALRKVQFHNPIIEEFLTACRQCILQESIAQQQIDRRFMNFLVSISLQCVNNEFVYAVSLTEEKVLAELTEIVSSAVHRNNWKNIDVEYPLLLLSMYSLLHHYNFRDHLLRKAMSSWSKPMQLIIEPHLYEPHKETEIQSSIESLSSIIDPTSQEVQKQYESCPYPRWTALDFSTKTDYGQALSAELKGFTPPSFFNNQTTKVLIAGCGTGKHAIRVAKYFRNVDVTAIDLSLASLAYGKKMARKFDIENIEFLQADILNLDNLREKYHIIECSGVLHHMQDPVKGWRALIKLLEPGGLLKVALYSEKARSIVTTARELIKENQLSTSTEHIRIFRQAILDNLLDGDFSLIKQSNDFYNLSGCRDLLFHTTEYQFNPLSIQTILQELELNFLGFVNLESKVKQAFDLQYTNDKNRIQLANWEQFETKYPDTFGGMFQFYCQLKAGTVANFP
jgi:ubiquinone/menaquinone biosynthesis C-methylase UbiE